MINHTIDSSKQKTARVAGLLSIILLVSGSFALFIESRLIVPGNIAITAGNILASETLFRFGFTSGLICQTLFILFAILLYKLYKPVNKNWALIMLIFALIPVPIAMLSHVNQFGALLLLKSADCMKAFTINQVHAQAMFFLDLHKHGILIATIFWGIWLLPLGFLAFKSGFVPKIFGVLLMIGCFGYVMRFFLTFLFQSYSGEFSLILAAAHIGEVSHGLWLLIKGVNVEQWEKRALESA